MRSCPLHDQNESALGQNRRISAQQRQVWVQKSKNHNAALRLKPLATIFRLPAIADARSQDQLLVNLTRLRVDSFTAGPFQPFTPLLLVGLDEFGPVVC